LILRKQITKIWFYVDAEADGFFHFLLGNSFNGSKE
jgi:hypothetical protein